MSQVFQDGYLAGPSALQEPSTEGRTLECVFHARVSSICCSLALVFLGPSMMVTLQALLPLGTFNMRDEPQNSKYVLWPSFFWFLTLVTLVDLLPFRNHTKTKTQIKIIFRQLAHTSIGSHRLPQYAKSAVSATGGVAVSYSHSGRYGLHALLEP